MFALSTMYVVVHWHMAAYFWQAWSFRFVNTFSNNIITLYVPVRNYITMYLELECCHILHIETYVTLSICIVIFIYYYNYSLLHTKTKDMFPMFKQTQVSDLSKVYVVINESWILHNIANLLRGIFSYFISFLCTLMNSAAADMFKLWHLSTYVAFPDNW